MPLAPRIIQRILASTSLRTKMSWLCPSSEFVDSLFRLSAQTNKIQLPCERIWVSRFARRWRSTERRSSRSTSCGGMGTSQYRRFWRRSDKDNFIRVSGPLLSSLILLTLNQGNQPAEVLWTTTLMHGPKIPL